MESIRVSQVLFVGIFLPEYHSLSILFVLNFDIQVVVLYINLFVKSLMSDCLMFAILPVHTHINNHTLKAIFINAK